VLAKACGCLLLHLLLQLLRMSMPLLALVAAAASPMWACWALGAIWLRLSRHYCACEYTIFS
jgi:hypothetical protein